MDDQSGNKFSGTSTGNREQAPAAVDIREVPTSPPTVAMTDATYGPPTAKDSHIAGKWLRLPGARFLAEIWFAWRASHKLLNSYKRIHREEPRLIR